MNTGVTAVVLVDERQEMEVDIDVRAYDALAQNARIADLAAIARAVMTNAAETRRAQGMPELVARLSAELRLTRDETLTPLGNALDVLSRGPADNAERALASALAAHAVAMQPPKHPDEEERTANDLLWLATHTPYDATGLLDRALGSGATALWDAIADQIRRVDQGNLSSLGRGEALVAAVALAKSRPNGAAKPASALAGEIRDPMIARVLGAPSAERTEEPMIGEMTAAPRGPLATAVLALTGVLFLWRASALLARLALAYRQPAEVTLGDGGVRIRWRVELLGRPLRDRDILLPHGSLVRATRELRYPRLPLYAGLIALAVGSYVGVSAFVDGVRTASPSLLATGIAIVALGLVLDFVLSSAVPGARARCRLIFVSRTGTKLCVGNVDVRQADTLLARLAKR